MDFTSQICTTKEQSERLLALGLKKETADMMLVRNFGYLLNEPYRATVWDPHTISIHDNFQEFIDSMTTTLKGIDKQYVNDGYKPAWSLHRLIEMMPMLVNPIRNLFVSNRCVEYQMSEGRTTHVFANESNIYDNVINCIEWLISVDEFNKEYLEE